MVFALLPLAWGAPEVPDPVPAYPTELPVRLGDPRWQRADLRARQVARVGAVWSVASCVGAAAGTGMVALGNDARGVGMTGGLVQLASAPGLVVAPPVLLAASSRSARALRKSGVRVGRGAAAAGWTFLAMTPLFLATLNRDAEGRGATDRGMLPLLSYGAALGFGALQLDVNRRARRGARLQER